MISRFYFLIAITLLNYGKCRDEEKIMKACYWPKEIYEPCFGGCAEVSCDNPRDHLRPCYPYCEPGCICEEPYVRDDRTHQCVLPQDCSPTQMGIPVPTKRSDKPPLASKYSRSSLNRLHTKREEPPIQECPESDLQPLLPSSLIKEDYKRPEVSRMGNYFNIVIAPPPIKALQPRKLVENAAYAGTGKKFSYNSE